MEIQTPSTFHRISQWLKESLLVKLLAIGFLILLLLIPNAMIQDLIRERQNRQSEVIQEVSRSWGGSQSVVGPILSIPFSEWKEYDGKRSEVRHLAHFLPQKLEVKSDLEHQIRKRSIFDVVLYQATIQLSGEFTKPDFAALHVAPENIHWGEAKLSLAIQGMTGIKEIVQLDWAGNIFQMEPGTYVSTHLPSGVSVEIPVNAEVKQFSFSIPLKLNGSEYLSFEPVGKTTSVRMTSGWHSPSFDGIYLPDHREISATGFTADWQVLDLNRSYPQQWTDDAFRPGEAGIGVRLIKPVDEYLKTTRSAKYAILVIGLTFLMYFFFEVLRRLFIHPFQYLLVGLALTVFYLLLLSFSEHLGFNLAYFIAAAATVLLITGYSFSVLGVKRLVLQLFLLLAAIYGFIYILLQLEDYALLAGSLGVFIALATVMFFSRKVNWYNLGGRKPAIENS